MNHFAKVLRERADDPRPIGPTILRRAADEIERLHTALKPFAEAGDDSRGYPVSVHIGFDPASQAAALTVADLRAATRAYKRSKV